jgi:dihydrodipicolinate reductase
MIGMTAKPIAKPMTMLLLARGIEDPLAQIAAEQENLDPRAELQRHDEGDQDQRDDDSEFHAVRDARAPAHRHVMPGAHGEENEHRRNDEEA